MPSNLLPQVIGKLIGGASRTHAPDADWGVPALLEKRHMAAMLGMTGNGSSKKCSERNAL